MQPPKSITIRYITASAILSRIACIKTWGYVVLCHAKKTGKIYIETALTLHFSRELSRSHDKPLKITYFPLSERWKITLYFVHHVVLISFGLAADIAALSSRETADCRPSSRSAFETKADCADDMHRLIFMQCWCWLSWSWVSRFEHNYTVNHESNHTGYFCACAYKKNKKIIL